MTNEYESECGCGCGAGVAEEDSDAEQTIGRKQRKKDQPKGESD